LVTVTAVAALVVLGAVAVDDGVDVDATHVVDMESLEAGCERQGVGAVSLPGVVVVHFDVDVDVDAVDY